MLVWGLCGKSVVRARGPDCATTDAKPLRSGYFCSAPVGGATAAQTRAQVRSLTGCSYLSKYGAGPLHTHSRLPLAKSNSKVGRTAEVVYPHIIALRNEHFAAGSVPVGGGYMSYEEEDTCHMSSVPVGNAELSNLDVVDVSTAEREAIIQKPRAPWAAAHPI